MPTLFEYLPIGAYRSDTHGHPLRANDALAHLNGYQTPVELLASGFSLASDWYVQPRRRDDFTALMARDGHVTNFVSEVYRYKNREPIWVRETAHVVRSDKGDVLFYEGTVEDITESHLAAQTLVQAEARWRLALEATGDGVWDWHVPARRMYCTEGLKAMLGYASHEWSQEDGMLNSLTHPDDAPGVRSDLQSHLKGLSAAYRNEHRLRCKDGQWKWVLSRGMVVERDADGQALRFIGTHTDITARKASEAVIWQQAHFDTLTGLPNRPMLRQQLDAGLRRADATGHSVGVVFIDLDHFKEVNDSLGHNAGDLLLVQAARRI